MPLNISVVTNGRAGWINSEMLEHSLFQKLSLVMDPVLFPSSGRKRRREREPSARDQKVDPCTELVISGEELRNLFSGNFSTEDLTVM